MVAFTLGLSLFKTQFLLGPAPVRLGKEKASGWKLRWRVSKYLLGVAYIL